MRTGGIDSSQIQSMIAQLKAAATRPEAAVPAVQTEQPATRVDFSNALKGALDSVAESQNKAQDMSKRFQLGDDSVNLSDVMIQMQKASINFQATVQVRNKLVQAYTDIMNMQV
ncbi:flagellar hook-basal body complex protein FliE [Pseudoduganella albidiflava]|uniref:Flagellar hook-basal body complex protein FliE n=1 Tax=Pseudoduganella albidiflava TaxID=321983 RepID=A0A411WU30_9BURK|nr:flagellar hook-basal body complex protein FliE [Pseudoduganella albidiflava]QBI00204.1 flagellar hook-basal body complex protein FliE [Pseudoduganella albidiflava]GGY70132.1 flagellar hook-basal body complex protein FliE [Pseudoduganella albidiflava]